MRVLLVEPYLDYPVKASQVGVNIGLLSLSSYVKKHCADEHSFFFFSQQFQRALNRSINIGPLVKKLQPDIVGINALTSNFPNAIEIADTAKRMGCFVVMGGIYPSLNATSVLQENNNIDVIVRGEGEETFLRLIKHLEAGNHSISLRSIKGISFRLKGRIISTPDQGLIPIETLPMPDYSLIEVNAHLKLDVPASVETARGCSFNCIFCSLRDFWQRCYRKKPVSNVIDEIRRLRYEHGFEKIMLVDDTLTLEKERVRTLFHNIVKEQIDATFYILTRIDMVNTRILDLMYRSGVSQILFGVEHIEKNILLSMGKTGLPTKVSKWREITTKNIRSASKIGYEVHPVFMLGWPGESEKTLSNLANFIIRLNRKYTNVIPFLSFVTPHPGTRLWRLASRLGLRIIENDLSKYTHLYPVAIPYSLGVAAKERLVRAYNNIAKETNTEEWNPPISEFR